MIRLLAKLGFAMDGKKSKTGLLLTAVGIALFWTPAAPVAPKVTEAGLLMAGVGVVHKAMKKQKKEADRDG